MVWKKIILFRNFLGKLLSNFISKFSFQIRAISSGTAVPASAATNSNLEIQAQSTSNKLESVLEDVKTEFANIVEKETLVKGEAYTLDQDKADDYEAQIKTNLDFANDEKYSGITLEITPNTANVLDTSVEITLKVSGTINGQPKEATGTVVAPVDLITVSRIKEDFSGKADFSSIQPLYTTDTTKLTELVKAQVETAKKQMSLNQYVNSEDFEIDAELVSDDTDQDFGTRTWKYKITFTNIRATASDTVDPIELTFTADETAVATEADEALNYLKENLTEVTVPAGTNITINGDAGAKAITDAVKAAMEKTFEDSEYNSLGSKDANAVATNPQMIANGVWKADVEVTVNRKKAKGTITLTLKNAAAEEETVVKLELIDADSDVEVNTALKDSIEGVKVYFEDSSKAPVTVSAAALNNNEYFTYDNKAWNTSKLGQATVTFITKSASTPVTVDYTANVVSTVKYDESGNTSDGKGLNDNLKTAFGLAPEYIESISSSDTSVLKVAFDKTTKETTITGVKKGSAVVTVIGKAGRMFTTTVQVSDSGKFKADVCKEQTAKRYATGEQLGFEPHADNSKNTVTVKDSKPDNWQDDTVITADIVTLGDKEGVEINPVAEGTATVVVKGGDNGKLEATIDVVVGKNAQGVLVIENISYHKVNLTLSVGKSAEEKIQELNITGEDTLDVSDIGFTSSDKLGVKYTKDGKDITDTVPAEDVTEVIVNTNDGETATGITLKYYGKDVTVNFEDSGKAIVQNKVDDLGLVAKTVSKIENDPATDELIEDVEFTTNAKGEPVIVITPVDDVTGDAVITVADDLDNTATITVHVENGKATVTGTAAFELTGTWEIVAPTKSVYTIGESIDLTGGYLKSTDASGKEVRINLTADMISGFDTKKAALDGTAVKEQNATVAYGNVNLTFVYGVKPASTEVSVNSLGLNDDEKVVSVASRGDASISASLNSDKDAVVIVASEVEKTGSAVITTDQGRTVSIKISVDSEGNITTDVTEEFESSIAVVDNTEETLGVVGTEATSSNESVALVSVAGNKIIITSVAPGSATITVKDDENMAQIPVTVDEFGTITIGDIVKANSNGWVRGEGSDWYYYIDGEKVTNDWVFVIEEDPYNNNEVGKVWYHFDKDGKMQRGWIKDESGWKIYNLDSNGRMRHDMWINAEANDELGMPTGIYRLLSDGAALMNGWAESITEGIYWFCAPNSGVFDASNPANWATEMPK